ncbi:unnamed protein product [Prorocentrum cordatum]|uniref:Uncharacterized protein n=1 Tax=Prorocentrum cordatum TaxID=2364126 RepID=A0ABN9TXH2_9DINO|nr:unnamed protein product [Polarella glacialis]
MPAAKSKAAAKAKSGSSGGSGRNRSVHTRALQKLSDNFKDFPHECCYVRVLPSTGRTLIQQLEHDIARADRGEDVVWGAHYYIARKQEYSADDSYFVALKPDPSDQSVPNEYLMKAMQALKDPRKPDRGPMLTYLKTATEASKKDTQGVLRWLCGLRLADTDVQLPCADAVLAWMSRLRIHQLYPDLFAIAKDVVEKVLALRWGSVSKHVDQAEFCRNNERDLKLVYPVDPLRQVIAAGESWAKSCHTEIVQLARCGVIGEAMFHSKMSDVLSAAAAQEIDEKIVALCTPSAPNTRVPMNNEVFEDWRGQIVAEVNAIDGVEQLASKRFVDVPYRSKAIPKVPVTCMVNDVELRLWGVIKGSGVAHGQIPKHQAEVLLGYSDSPAEKALQVHDDMFSKAKLARQKLGQFIAAKQVASSDDMHDVVKTNKHKLEVMDPDSWALDHALLMSLCGATAEQRATCVIMCEMPAAAREITVKQCKARLETLANGEQMKMSPVGAQAGLKYLAKVLGSMCLGAPLEVKKDEVSKMVSDCVSTFQYFLSRRTTEGRVTGAAAYRRIVEIAEDAIKKKQQVDQKDFDDIVMYRYLCPSDIDGRVVQLIQECQKADGKGPPLKKPKTAGAAGGAAKGGGSSSSSGGGKQPKAQDLAKASAMAMFS